MLGFVSRVRPLVHTYAIAIATETTVSLYTSRIGKISQYPIVFPLPRPENDFHACPYSISRFSNRIVYT